MAQMKLSGKVDFTVEDAGSPEAEERILDICEEEWRRMTASLAERFEAEGITDVQINLS